MRVCVCFFILIINYLSVFSQQKVKYYKGCKLDSIVYNKIKESEFVRSRGGNISLPNKFSLEEKVKFVGNQGDKGTCVGWATSFYAMGILYGNESENNKDSINFSPYFLYNNLKSILDSNCQDGLNISEALIFLKTKGALPDSLYQPSCNIKSDNDSLEFWNVAYNYRIKDFKKIGPDQQLIRIKKALFQKHPVIIGINTPNSFETNLNGDSWDGIIDDFRGGHALCVLGYDDQKNGGAFQIVNSWGSDWGDSGKVWIRYIDFKKLVVQAFEIIGFSESEKEKLKNRYNYEFEIKAFENNGRELMVEEELFSFDNFLKFQIDAVKPSGVLNYGFKISSFDSAYVYLFKTDAELWSNKNYKLIYKNSGTTPFLAGKNNSVILPETDYFNLSITSYENSSSEYVLLFCKQSISDDEIEKIELTQYTSSEDFIDQNFGYLKTLKNPTGSFLSARYSLKNDPGTVLPILLKVNLSKPKIIKKKVIPKSKPLNKKK